MMIFKAVLATLILMPLVAVGQGNDDVGPKKVAKDDDLSRKVKRFNLHEHLMSPTKKDLQVGVENSRRLARNAIRLGVGTDAHRALVAGGNDFEFLVTQFDLDTPLPSTGPRVVVDTVLDPLPFGDGPGVFPGLPTGTKEYWEDGGNPSKMWEVVACPVADVESFLANPLRCVFGNDVTGGITDFITDITDSAISSVMTGAIVPLATEAIWTFSGLAWLETLFTQICSILGIVDSIVDAVQKIGDVVDEIDDIVGSLGSAGGGLISSIGGIFGRTLEEGGGDASYCTGHFETCVGDADTCVECFNDAENKEVCADCKTCWQPLQGQVPDMQGLCIDTASLRDFHIGVASFYTTQSLFSLMLTNYANNQDAEIIEVIKTALGTDGEEDIKTIISNAVGASNTDLTGKITSAKDILFAKIEDQCLADDATADDADTRERRRLGTPEQKIEEFFRSNPAKEAKRTASEMGLASEQVDAALGKLLKGFSGAETEGINDKLKNAFDDPKVLGDIDSLLNADIEKNADNYATDIAGRLLKGAVNPATGQLESERIREITGSLKKMRNLGSATRSLDSNLETQCTNLVSSVENTIKGFISDILTTLISDISSIAGGSDGPFDDIASTFEGKASSLFMPLGFALSMDAVGENGPLNAALGTIIEITQSVVCIFLFGVDDGGDCNGVLPSTEPVLPIAKTRDGVIFMNSGCNSEFEGELEWYKPAIKVLNKLLEAAGNSVIEFINIPIFVIKFLLDVVETLFDHMGSVCGYLDGYVQLAKIEATYENSRYALHELACRSPKDVDLQKGYGCDGLDNTCDSDKQIDECAEDIFPPDIDATLAFLECDSKIFHNIQEAMDCVKTYTSAVDDCKPVLVETSTSFTTGDCASDVTLKATAQGCNGRSMEDISSVTIPVQIDGAAPYVSCSFAPGTDLRERYVVNEEKNLMILRSSDDEFKDGGFSIDIEENCDGVVSVDVLVKSNEFANEKMVQVVRDSTIGTAQQMELFIAPTSCNDEGAPNICKKDPSATDHRLYDIHVTAKDLAGNEGKTTCTMIIYSGLLLKGRNKVCGNFALHARTAITFSEGGLTTIDGGDVGVSPGTAITGTPKIHDGTVVGNSDVFAASVKAEYDVAMAFHAGEKFMAIEMGGLTFIPGTYRSDSAINIAHGSKVTLDGNGVFLFIAVTTLVTAADIEFILVNGATAENVIWALGTAATLGARSVVEGSILAGTAITFEVGSKLNGCALAQSAVTFAFGGSIKARDDPGQTLVDVAPSVTASVANSRQRFDVAALSLEWSSSNGNTTDGSSRN